MGEKDILEKSLCAYNDVFSDIVNNLVFGGSARVLEDQLENATVHTAYQGENAFRELERDVSKFWMENDIRIALLGVENESQPEDDMAFRIIGYDGASYRDQIRYETDESGNRKKIISKYPVVTLVLYFGYKERWNKARSLHEALGDKLIPELKPLVPDYPINVYEIAWLTDEQLNGFKSDFRYVADYFVQMRRTGKYNGSKEKMRHVREVLQLMSRLTGDDRFVKVMEEGSITEEGGPKSMSEALDFVENRGWIRGLEQGETYQLVKQICKKLRAGKDTEQIALEVEESVEWVKEICDIAEHFAPEYDEQKVFEAVTEDAMAVI